MTKRNFEETLDIIIKEDCRYSRDAYYFVRKALEYATEHFEKPPTGAKRHLTATELMDCIRLYAIEQFGPLTLNVLHHWGIYCTEDVGEIVFNLVEKKALGKSEEDSKEDFKDGYDFGEAFTRPFLPPSHPVFD